ncbi:MAG: hypothetical protein PVS2B1_24570 [Candidatus Dormibacteraceae bacterium]
MKRDAPVVAVMRELSDRRVGGVTDFASDTSEVIIVPNLGISKIVGNPESGTHG